MLRNEAVEDVILESAFELGVGQAEQGLRIVQVHALIDIGPFHFQLGELYEALLHLQL